MRRNHDAASPVATVVILFEETVNGLFCHEGDDVHSLGTDFGCVNCLNARFLARDLAYLGDDPSGPERLS